MRQLHTKPSLVRLLVEAKDKSTDEKPNAGEPIPGSSIDALGYCYGIATHLVGLCEALMALPEIASPIANPLR
jgi:hypothetical protein